MDSSIDPKSIPLRPEETLVSAQSINASEPTHPLTALAALQVLTDAQQPEDIGTRGPAKASAAFPENQAIRALRSYEVVCGRDSLITARLLFGQFPALTRATIQKLTELQGVRSDTMSEEEPGKIVHEARSPDDPIAQEVAKKWGWKVPYYGTIDATPRFLSAIAQYVETYGSSFLQETVTGRDGLPRTIEAAAQAALDWLIEKLNYSPDGLLESRRLNTVGGLIGQSWKDSPEAYHHADGSLVDFNASLCSIDTQAVTYDALLDAARLFPNRASELQKRAAQLRKTILDTFWIEDTQGGYFVLGSERDESGVLHLLKVRTSNMGHLLSSRLLDGGDAALKAMRDTLVATLFPPPLLAQAGIRTLATTENRYRPSSYHNGSVWPWDTCWISLGLLRHGYTHEAQQLRTRIASVLSTTHRYPELVSGADDHPLITNRLIKVYDTKYQFENVIEQPPQEIQAWTVASALAIETLQEKHGRI